MKVKSNNLLMNTYNQCENCLYELVGIVVSSGATDEFYEKEIQSYFRDTEELMGILKTTAFHYRETGDINDKVFESVVNKVKNLDEEVRRFKKQYYAYKETRI